MKGSLCGCRLNTRVFSSRCRTRARTRPWLPLLLAAEAGSPVLGLLSPFLAKSALRSAEKLLIFPLDPHAALTWVGLGVMDRAGVGCDRKGG